MCRFTSHKNALLKYCVNWGPVSKMSFHHIFHSLKCCKNKSKIYSGQYLQCYHLQCTAMCKSSLGSSEAAIGQTFTHHYQYSAIRLTLIYHPLEGERLSQPRHCSKYAAHKQSCTSLYFFVKTHNCIQYGFDRGTSRTAGKNATTRPQHRFMIDKICNETNLHFKWL